MFSPVPIALISSQYPLVSALYKMFRVGLDTCIRINYFKGIGSSTGITPHATPGSISLSQTQGPSLPGTESQLVDQNLDDRANCFRLFSKYVREVQARYKQYSGDLLAACLELLLSLPREFIAEQLDTLVPALKHALKIGLVFDQLLLRSLFTSYIYYTAFFPWPKPPSRLWNVGSSPLMLAD